MPNYNASARRDLLPNEFKPLGVRVTIARKDSTYHRDIRAEVPEWVCFSTDEPGELDAVRSYFRGVDKIADMAKEKFIAYNRDSGEELGGKLF